jgi:two-component system nitrogen regulation sensor histidine kinase NtrY
MSSLRARLLLVFAAATLLSLAGTVWVTQSLIRHSLTFSNYERVDELSRSLETTGRELYAQAKESLKHAAAAGEAPVRRFTAPPDAEAERFERAGDNGNILRLSVLKGKEVWVYERSLGEVGLDTISRQYRDARAVLDSARARDLQRGFLFAGLLLVSAVWLLALLVLLFFANRISRPIRQLTRALSVLESGDASVRVPEDRADEVGMAMRAFNRMAGQLEQDRQRLVYLTQVATWQTLARKMAHEVKNSLTPIRLNVEEIVARGGQGDSRFLEQAAQIVIEEIGVLERRIRAFSELGAEPPVQPELLDVSATVEERVAFLQQARPEVAFEVEGRAQPVPVVADPDLLRGILNNLMENGAYAAGSGGKVLLRCGREARWAWVEVHDSGPGLSAAARLTLFEPTISFKKGGMGIGLSIARKHALACGGDIQLIDGALGGAGFRVTLPAGPGSGNGWQNGS